jgi:hypothetical protein
VALLLAALIDVCFLPASAEAGRKPKQPQKIDKALKERVREKVRHAPRSPWLDTRAGSQRLDRRRAPAGGTGWRLTRETRLTRRWLAN